MCKCAIVQCRIYLSRPGAGAGGCKIDLDSPSSWPASNPPIILDQVGDFLLPRAQAHPRLLELTEDQVGTNNK